MGDYIKSLTYYTTSEDELNEVRHISSNCHYFSVGFYTYDNCFYKYCLQFQSFLDSVKPQLKESEIVIRQGIETALNNIAWHAMHYEELSRYFENN